jgi:MATE family multidrug resistance protein
MRRTVRQGFWALVALALPTWAALWHAEALLLAIGQEPRLAALAGDYVRALMWELPLFCGFIVLRGFLAAMERPGPALGVSLVAIGVNALLVWLLVFGAFGWPGLGVAGAGIATTLTAGFMLATLGLLIARDRMFRRFRLLGRFWRSDWPRLAELFRIGLPIAGAMLLEIGVFTGAALVIGWLGAAAVAAHAIAIQMASATFMVPMGIGQAATARVGLAAGAGDAAGAARAGWTAVALGAGFMAAMAVALILAAGPLAWLFLDPADPRAAAAAALGASLLTVAGVFQLGDGVQVVAAGALRGLKDTRVPMLFAALGYWGIGLPAGLALAWPAGLGAVGIWIGLAAGLAVVSGLMLWRWRALSREPAARAAGIGATLPAEAGGS